MSTFAELKDRAQNMALTEDATTAGAMVNDVYRDIVVQAQLKCTTVDRALTFSDNLYTISDEFGLTDLGQVQYIMYTPNGENQGYVLEPSDLETVLQLSSTSPTGYVRKYAFQGLDNLSTCGPRLRPAQGKLAPTLLWVSTILRLVQAHWLIMLLRHLLLVLVCRPHRWLLPLRLLMGLPLVSLFTLYSRPQAQPSRFLGKRLQL